MSAARSVDSSTALTGSGAADPGAFTSVTVRDADGTEREIARVFLDARDLDAETIAHIRGQSKSSTLAHVRIMPDCHVGIGCCVGLTSLLTSRIVPALIGPDIGCGVLSYPLGKLPLGSELDEDEKNARRLDRIIRELVPLGGGEGGTHAQAVVTREEIEENVCVPAQRDAQAFVEAYRERFGVDISFAVPTYSYSWFEATCKRVKANRDNVLRGLGTLGGGNHFIEVNKDSTNTHYLTVHCGSRSFGTQVCGHHQRLIYDEKTFDEHSFMQAKKQLKQLKKSNRSAYDVAVADLRQRICDGKHPPYLEKEEAYAYFVDMIFAQYYAQFNRRLILRRVHAAVQQQPQFQDAVSAFDPSRIIESTHNFIDFRDLIVRKGAISARKDEPCLVALNMRDGILLCRGKGNDEWNSSCAHGCGRIMSREAARQSLGMAAYRDSMAGIYSSSVSERTLDESPAAYKSSELIRRTILHTVDIVEQLRPVLNIKADST